MCGMCLPHCPTYQLYQNEAESPRGRIALMQSIDAGRIQADEAALLHIDHCLGCLNCQTICPSRVPYGSIIDSFRTDYHDDIAKPWLSRQLLARSSQSGGLESALSTLNRPGIRQLVKMGQSLLGIPGPALEPAARLTGFSNTPAQSRGQIGLFTGCTGKQLDSHTLRACGELLSHFGFQVELVNTHGTCCGALHQHNGAAPTAEALAQQLQHDFEQSRFDHILFFSPACGQQLASLQDTRLIDARLFILQQLHQQQPEFSPLQQPVALHQSCSHRNLLKAGDINYQLLAFIPELEVIESSMPDLCCGAGGIQHLNYPEQAQALVRKKIQTFDLQHCEILLSDNIGCSMHMKSHLNTYNLSVDVMHPLSLLNRQLIRP